MRTETIVRNEEAAKGLVKALLEDEVIRDFEIWMLKNGDCKVVLWFIES